jgi:hypothetical protein
MQWVVDSVMYMCSQGSHCHPNHRAFLDRKYPELFDWNVAQATRKASEVDFSNCVVNYPTCSPCPEGFLRFSHGDTIENKAFHNVQPFKEMMPKLEPLLKELEECGALNAKTMSTQLRIWLTRNCK